MADKITQVYNAYKADGATRAKSEQQFRNWMYGDNYRRGVWNDLRKQGASVGTFEHFTEALGYKMNPKVKSKVAKQAIQYGAPKVPDNWGQMDTGRVFANDEMEQQLETQRNKQASSNAKKTGSNEPIAQRVKENLNRTHLKEASTSNNLLGSFADGKTFTPTLKEKDTPAQMFRESELGDGYVLDYGKKDPKTGEVSIELERKIRDDADREAQKLNQQIIESLSEEAEARARKKQRETIGKEMSYVSTDANEGMGALFGGIRRANIEHGTENEYVDAYLKAMNTPEFKSKIEEAAKKAGVDPEYLYNNHVLPRAKEDIRNHLIESGTPKSTADYIMQGALDGIAGNMFKRGLMTADQRTVMDEATAKKAEEIEDERKRNGFFSTATLTSVGRTAMGGAADAAAFAGAGKIAGGMMSGLSYGVNLITKTPLGKRLFGSVIGTSAKALEKKFGAEGAARIANFIGNNNGFWKTLLTTGSKNTMQSGLTFANYNVMQYMTGEGYDKMEKGTTFADYIIGMVDAGNSGFKTGLLFGAVGSVGGKLGRNVGITGNEAGIIERLKHGVRKAAVKTGTFVAESLAFRSEQMAEEWAKDNKINFVDNFIEGALENLSIKLGSAMGGGKVAHFSPSRIMRGLVFAEGNSGLKLTKEERSEFMSNTKAKSLLEACEALEPNHKTQGEGLAMEVSTPTNGQSSYEARQETANKKQVDLSERTPGGQAVGKLQQFLDDKSISWTLRQKVAAALGGTMSNSRPRTDRVSVTENGGKFSVSEYSKDGELLSTKEYNDKDGAEAAKQEIYLKRQDRDFKNAYLSAMRISTEDEKQECIEKVAEELGYKSAAEMLLESARRNEEGDNELDKEIGDAYKRIAEQMEGAKAKRVLDIQREVGEEFGVDLDKAMDKDYSKRSSVEEQAIEEFKKRLTGLSEDKNDIEQLTTTASQEGSDLAEQTDIEDSTDFTEKAQAVNDRQASARAAWDELVKANPDLDEWMKGNPDFDISDLRENFGDAVADTWAEVHAADSMKAGFVDHVGQSIEDAVKNQAGQAKFSGTMQDKEGVKIVTDNSVTVFADKDGNEYTLVGGDVIVDTAGDGSYSAGKSGLVIFRDKEGNLVQRTNFDGLNEVGTFSLEDYANRVRITLQEQKTAEIQSTEQQVTEQPKVEGPEQSIKGVSTSNSSDLHLAEHQNDVPDLLPTQETDTPSAIKDTNNSSNGNGNSETLTFKNTEEAKEESNYEKNDIPMDNEGEPVYEQVSKERTAQDLFDKLGDGNVAHDYAQIRIEGAEKELKEAKKKEPKIGTKINEYLKKKQEYEDRVKAAEDKVAYWESVKEEIEKLTHTTPEELKEAQEELDGTAAREEYKKTFNETQPADGVSLAAMFVVDARITPESFKKETGLGTAEQRSFVGMIANAEKGGKSIERLGEDLVYLDNTEYGGVYFHGDTNDARSAIISALMSAKSRKGLREMAQPDMEREVRERARMRDEAYHERYGMDYEEYLSYSEQEMPHILGKLNNFDEQKYLQDKAEEITNQIEKEHGKADRENDSSREESVHGAGDKVLPEERVDDRGRGESPKEHGGREKNERRGNTENAPLHETPSGGEVKGEDHKEEKPSDPSDAAEGMRGAAEQFHQERAEKARKAYEEAKVSGDASEIKRTKDEYRKALDDKLKAQGVGLVKRRKTIAKEMGEEPKVEGPKGEEPKSGEKQWEEMTPTERAEKADADPLTEDEIRSDEDNKELAAAAIAYLNGDKSLLNQIAYLKIYGNVRSRHEDVPGNSGTEDTSQLAATDNGGGEGMELESGRGSGGTAEPMDRGAGGETAPGKQESGETGKGNADTPAGEGSHIEGEGGTPGLGGLPAGSGGRTGSGNAGSTGSVGRGRGRGSGSRPSKSNGKRKPAAKQGTTFPNSKGRDVKQETKDAKAAMLAAFAEFNKRNKKDKNILSSSFLLGLEKHLPTAEALEYLPDVMKATGRYGVALIGEGIYKTKEWIKNVREAIFDVMKEGGFSDADIDEYIREMWHMPWEMDGETHKIGEWASIKGYAVLRESLKEPLRKKFDKQVLAEQTEVKVGDRKNIEETLPFLLPQQQDDVLKAETQFFDKSHKDKAHANGKGYMFTNGTGTGKTYTGLGIIKRMVKQGKGRILIITPSQQKVKDWINDGKNLCLDIRDLDDWANERGSTATNEKGDGVVITTFANFGTNKKLLEDQFDAIIYDESHRIMENKNATETARSRQHYMLSNRNESYALMRLEEINPDCMKMRGLAEDFEDASNKEIARIKAEYEKNNPSADAAEVRIYVAKNTPRDIHSFSAEDKAKFPKLGKIYEDYIKARDHYINNVKPELEKQAKESVDKTKVVFLSATPFNTRENIEYAEGYLFSYPERNEMGQSGKTQFFLEHFGAGYKYRYHRLESSTSNAEALAKQEIAFSDWLQNDLGTMSGRVIDSPFDYSRDFPTVSVEHADEFNTACEEISRDKIFGDAYGKVLGDYNYGSALFETMKVSALLPRLREHLAAGRKIVIFHRRVTSKEPLKAPFGMILGEQAELTIKALPKEKQPEARIRLNELRDKYSGLLEWEKTLDFSMPREQFAKAFGEDNVLYFSGSENKKVKSEAVKQFNDDNSGKNIIVIQEASGKEGISLHDTTGKHQRVCITLALPQSPITALQIEGRIYRIGNESNAIFEYPVLGLTSEYNLFANKFNRQVSTTENLALGSQARNLRDSFARGIEEHGGVVPIDQQGVGGKEFDKGDANENDPFDNAVLDYYTNQRLNKNNREGVDYFPTPEPLGYKMVEWANIGEGDSVLEPSAGHGAIARYVPQSNELVAIEPSMSLFAKLRMKAGGLGRKFQNETFEAYHISNKHDTIVMNPPFGHAGATAIAHIEKAFGHLEEGGRMVAIIPRGAMDKKFDKWYDNEKTAAMRAEVDLPDIVFQQAGTSVRCRVVVVDKITDSKLREQAHMEKADLSGHYDKIEDFFNDLRNIEVPDRIIDTNFKMQKMSKSAVKSLKEIRDVWSADVDKDGVHVRTSSWMGYDISFTGSEDPKRWKDKMAATYDKYAQMEKSELREGNKAVFGELKELACKLAGMTEDEMRRYLVSKGTGGLRFRKVDDPKEIERLEKEPTVKVYRAMQMIDGKLYPPMAAKVRGELVEPRELGEWERADENIDLAIPDIDKKTGKQKVDKKTGELKWKFKLDKGGKDAKGKKLGDVPAAYNPYWHTSRSPLNDQFSSAYKRPNLRVVEVEVPVSELTSGYKAERAKDAVGEMAWHSGPVSSKLPKEKERKVILSRWDKPVRVLSDAEAADKIAEILKGEDIEIPDNTITPSLKEELIKRGLKVTETDEVKDWNESLRFRKGDDLTPEERRAEERMEEHHVEVAKAAEKLNTKVNVCVDINDVTNAEARAAIERGEKVKAWYDTRTGEVHVYLPNVTDKYDAQMSVAHEVVAHKGMRGLLGEEGYRSMMRRMYTHLSNEEVKEVNERMMKNGWDFYTAMDEWVADKAEESVFTPKYVVMKDGLHRYPLDKVFHIVTEAMHDVGYRINPNVDDVKYWLWASKKGLKNGDAYTEMKRNSFLWRLNHNTSNDGIENGEFVETGGVRFSNGNSKLNGEDSEKLFASLQNKKGKEYYDTVTEIARRVSDGRARFTRLPEEYERRGVLSIPHAAARAIASAWVRDTERSSRNTASSGWGDNHGINELGENREESAMSQIEGWAKRNECWINEDDYISKGYKDNRNGSESVVYFVGDKVVKFANPQAHFSVEGLNGFLDNVILMNIADPEAESKIIGFSRDNSGKFRVVLEQKKFAKTFEYEMDKYGEVTPKGKELYDEWVESIPEIEQQLARRGIEYDSETLEATYNGIVISDLWSGNIACDENGLFHIIDGNTTLVSKGKVQATAKPIIIDKSSSIRFRKGDKTTDDRVKRESTLFRKQSLDRSKNDTPLMSATKDSIDKALNNWNARRIECWTDDKHGLRVFQQELAKGLTKGMNDSMDSYHGGINQSSIVREKQYQFETRELKTMNDAVKECTRKLGGGMEGYEELNKYAYVKSGLERNRVLFVRDAAEQVDKKIMKLNKEALDKDPQATTLAKMGVEEFRDAFHSEKKFQETLLNSGKISLAQYYKALDDFIKDFSFPYTGNAEKDALIDKLNDWYADKIGGKYDENENDYSGIRKFDDFDSDAERIDYVMSTEATLGDESRNKLWKGIGGVTRFAIDNDYNYGVISKDVHSRVSSMFSWYIPMRGFKENTMEDMYAYMNNEISDGGMVGSVVKRADGRTTLADSPLGTAAALAERSISNGEDNRNKQRLYRLVNQWLKDHTITNEHGEIELTEEAPAVISEVWYKKVTDHTTGDTYWEAVMPDIDGEKDPKQIRAKVERFEENMRNAEKNGNATRTLQKGTYAKPFEVAKHKNEHVVFVNVNGKQKMIIMQGNPRPAQAINGDTASDVSAGKLMRGMSAMFTSYNITFSVTNTSRDTFFANNNVAIREDAAYYARFVKNQALMGGSMLQGTVMLNSPKVKGMYYQLWSDYKKGKKPTGKYGKYFEEYMNNGGKTGFVQTKTIEDLEEHIRKEATQKALSASTLGKVAGKVPEVIEALNERSENMNRFACYVTSREMGRSIMRSVSDAKEVSTNFNRKGSGSKAFKGTNAKAWEKWQGWLYDKAKGNYLFFNAGMQSLSLLSNNWKRHPVKTAAFAVGIPILFASSIIPAINSWIASCFDEDDQYDNLSEWERRNNICIYAGHSNWVKVPLPIELRAFYGLGDVALGVVNPAFRSENGLTIDVMSQLSQILSLDFMGEGGDLWGALAPDWMKPLYHVAVNRDWTGKPIYKDYDYLKYEPEYQKVFQGENEWFVSFSKFINEQSGGNEHVKGSLDGKWNNPAIWGEIITGYGGGALSDAIRTGKLATRVATWDWEDFSTREIPMARALYSSATEKTKYYRSLSKYAHYKEDADKYLHDFKANLKSDNPLYVIKAISDMKRESPEFVRMVKIHGFEKSIKDLKKIANNEKVPKKDRDEAKELINQAKVKLVKEFESDE